jgi:hypothetical protein
MDVATVLHTEDSVAIFRQGKWVPAIVGESLSVGDKVRTGEGSRATIRLPDKSIVQMICKRGSGDTATHVGHSRFSGMELETLKDLLEADAETGALKDSAESVTPGA